MDILREEQIKVAATYANQAEVFTEIAAIAVAANIATQPMEVIASLKAQEQEGTTGMMDGFAIPHGKSSAINRPGIIIISLKEGIEWQSLDGQAITFVVALLIPAGEAGTTHIKLLSKVARMLMQEPIKEALKLANTAKEIHQIINSNLGA